MPDAVEKQEKRRPGLLRRGCGRLIRTLIRCVVPCSGVGRRRGKSVGERVATAQEMLIHTDVPRNDVFVTAETSVAEDVCHGVIERRDEVLVADATVDRSMKDRVSAEYGDTAIERRTTAVTRVSTLFQSMKISSG